MADLAAVGGDDGALEREGERGGEEAGEGLVGEGAQEGLQLEDRLRPLPRPPGATAVDS